MTTDASHSIKNNNDPSIPILNLSDYAILPGLINAHDHLEFGLFPNIGRSAEVAPYQNSSEWAIKFTVFTSPPSNNTNVFRRRFIYGGERGLNLLCGVTTVCHHNPLHPDFELSEFPVQVVARYGWAHSLAFESDIHGKFRNTPLELPFIIHAAEGIDAASFEEIFQLDHMQVLDEALFWFMASL